ncbi:MAG: T9SS type A sorting domain-containing protein [Flavobacteriales bacterium]
MKHLITSLIVLTSMRMSAQYVQDAVHIHNAVSGTLRAMASKGDKFVMAFRTGDYVQFGDNELYTDLADKALIMLKSENLGTIWTTEVEFQEYDISYINDASFDSNGNIYLCGSSNSASYSIGEYQDSASGFILKLDPDGNPLWLHGIEYFTPESIDVTVDNGAVVVGHFRDSLTFAGNTYINPDVNGKWFPPIDACILKIAADETEEWARVYSTVYDEMLYDVSVDGDGGIYALADTYGDDIYFNSEPLPPSRYLFKFSNTGEELWHKSNGSLVTVDNVGSGRSISITTSENNQIFWLHTFGTDTLYTPVGNLYRPDCELLDGNQIKAIYKFDSAGNMLDVFGFGCVDLHTDWSVLPINNQILISGEFLSTVSITASITLTSTGDADNGFIMLLDQNMEPIWHIQTTEQNEDAKVHLDKSILLDNSVIVAGSFEHEFTYENYSFVPDQNFDNILIVLDTTNSIIEYNAPDISVFPNPVANTLTIQNLLATNTQIKITDTTGRVLSIHQNQTQIDISRLPCGIYFIEVSTDESRTVLRFVKE